MAIVPENRDRLFDSWSDGDPFQRHDERMKRFRLAHPGVWEKGPKDMETRGRLFLVPLPLVELDGNRQN